MGRDLSDIEPSENCWCMAGGSEMKVEDCTIEGNKLNGLLIRDGASPQVLRTTVTNNSAFGIVLQVTKYS